MKAKLNLTIEQELIPLTKEYARARGMSVSQLVETLLRDVTQGQRVSFSSRWRGKFKPASRSDARYKRLEQRYLT